MAPVRAPARAPTADHADSGYSTSPIPYPTSPPSSPPTRIAVNAKTRADSGGAATAGSGAARFENPGVETDDDTDGVWTIPDSPDPLWPFGCSGEEAAVVSSTISRLLVRCGRSALDRARYRGVMEQGAGLKRWRVASGVIMGDDGLLLVANRRRNGDVDWSTPGGVVDPGESTLGALTREVFEETGIGVTSWSDTIYEVEVVAPDHGFHLEVWCHQANEFTGSILVDDPDGIVIAAEYVAIELVADWLNGSPPWVAEPLIEFLSGTTVDRHRFRYRLTGGPSGERRVLRLHDG